MSYPFRSNPNKKSKTLPLDLIDQDVLRWVDEQPSLMSDENTSVVPMTIDYYHDRYFHSQRAQHYITRDRALSHPDLPTAFHIGFSDRTLGRVLPSSETRKGGELRGLLRRAGVLRESGSEAFRACVIFPVFDEDGHIIEAYGRKISDRQRKESEYYVSMSGLPTAVFNQVSLRGGRETILCKSPLEAASFWCAGHRNVVATIGLRGFSEEHINAFLKHDTQRVYVAFDNNDEGNQAAGLVAQALEAFDIECFRVVFPQQMDANAVLQGADYPKTAFLKLLRLARPLKQTYDSLLGR